MKGKFYGVGVGPGDPELITQKALRVLRDADIICVPVSRTEKRSLALSIVSPYIPAEKEILEIHLPMTDHQDTLESSWSGAAEQLVYQLNAGKHVALLTLGDPSLFSTYTYIRSRIAKSDPEIIIETIPGITSLSASAALVNLPLAEGLERLQIIPALSCADELNSLLAADQNIVLMKVSRQFSEIVSVLEQAGRLQDAVLVVRCGQPGEQVVWDLKSIVQENIDYMSLIIIKKGAAK